jgi:hypothetical protein
VITEEKYAYRRFFFRDHEITGFWMAFLERAGEIGGDCGAGRAGETAAKDLSTAIL